MWRAVELKLLHGCDSSCFKRGFDSYSINHRGMEVIILRVGNPLQFYISGSRFYRVLFHIQLMTKTNAASGS